MRSNITIRIGVMLFAVLLSLQLVACGVKQEDIIGTWTGSWEYNGHAIQATLVLREDNTFSQSSINDGETKDPETGTYKISGSKVVLKFDNEFDGTAEYKFHDGVLTNGNHDLARENNDSSVAASSEEVASKGTSVETTVEESPEERWKVDASEDEITEVQEQIGKGGIETYIDALRADKFKDNTYAQQMINTFDESRYNDWTPLEKDFVESYIHSYFPSSFGSKIITSDLVFSHVYIAGYDGENVVSDLPYQRRFIVLEGFTGSVHDKETKDISNGYVEWLIFHEDYWKNGADTYKKVIPLAAEYETSFNKDNMIYTYTDPSDKSSYELPCVELEKDVVDKYISDNQELIDAFKKYSDEVYRPIVIDKDFERAKKEAENEKKEPEIGMTKEEVLDSTWGAPKDKNITETANGTSEQWVYSTSRYIYFDNGKVTAIQK